MAPGAQGGVMAYANGLVFVNECLSVLRCLPADAHARSGPLAGIGP